MISQSSAFLVGASPGAGISIPDAIIFGGSGDTPTPTPTPNFNPIDLLSPVLDPRVTYVCSSEHFYHAQHGLLQLAAPNEWPLEYRDGVPVGRHEPEPAATNLQIRMRGATAVPPPHDVAWVRSADTDLGIGIGPDGGPIGQLTSDYNKVALYNASTGAWIITEYAVQDADSYRQTVWNLSVTAPTHVRTYVARISGQYYVYAYSEEIPPGPAVVSFFRRTQGAVTNAGFVQVETGSIATSPIITGEEPVTRAAAQVLLKTQGARLIRLTYSDQSTQEITVAGQAEIELPTSAHHWGVRYMQKIEFLE